VTPQSETLLGDLAGLREDVRGLRNTAAPDPGLDRVEDAITAMEICTRSSEAAFYELMDAVSACPMLAGMPNVDADGDGESERGCT
jgi:hypothetical protein